MKHTAFKISMLGFAGILFLACGSRARAGFVVPEFDANSANGVVSLLDSPTESHSGAGKQTAEQPPAPHDSRVKLQSLHALTSPTGSNMTGNGGPVSNGGTAPSVIVTLPPPSAGGLTAYLLQEPALLLPVPFLDGVFRPPRF